MPWLEIKTSKELHRFRIDDIVYIKADGNYSHLHLISGKEWTLTLQLGKLVDYLQKMDSKMFVLVGRSLLVNKDYVSYVSPVDRKLLLTDNRQWTIELNAKNDAPLEKALRDLKDLFGQNKQ